MTSRRLIVALRGQTTHRIVSQPSGSWNGVRGVRTATNCSGLGMSALTVRSLMLVLLRWPVMTHNWGMGESASVSAAAGSGNSRDAPGGLPRGLQHDCGTYQSILPEVPEASGGKLGVANCVLDIFVPEIVL